MDRLPSELLHIIFISLPIAQKQECILVCKQWAHIIRTRSLFHAVTIFHKQERFKEFIKMIEIRPALANQVKHLHLLSCIDDHYDQRKLLRLFHNLKTIKVTRHSQVKHPKLKEVPLDMLPSGSQLKHIEDSFRCEMAVSLLKSRLCSRLSTLTLSDLSKDILHRDVFLLLKEAPLLTKLELSNANINLNDCEIIHANLPLLESMSLLGCNFSTALDLPAKPISPVYAMTALSITVNTFEQQHDLTDWLRYLSFKYPNLMHLNFSLDPRNHLVKINNLKFLYENGYSYVLQQLGPRLKTLELIGVKHHNEIFKKLDILGCQIRNSALYDLSNSSLIALSESKQSKCIETLSLHLSQCISFEWIKEMKSLISLNVTFRETESIQFSDLLQLLPKNIERLSIFNIKISHIATKDQQFHIKDLYLKITDLSVSGRELGIFITKCFPKLNKLRLATTVDGNTTLMLPNHHFSMLDLDFGPSVIDYTITTLKDKKTRFFSKRKGGSYSGLSGLDGRLITPVTKNDLSQKTCLTVVCGSARDIYLGASRAYF